MTEESTKWICACCKKEFDISDFRIKSLIHKGEWVCESCAIAEDERWLNSVSKN